MSAALGYYRSAMLPWTVSEEDERRFRRILRRVLLVCMLFSLAMPWLPLPKVDRTKPEELPPRLAKLLLERRPAPPPVVAPSRVPEPEAPAAKPQPQVTKPEPKKPPVAEARKPEPNKAPGERLAAARRRASGVGLLAMKDELADLRSAPLAPQFQKDLKPGPGVGSGSGPGVGAGRSAGLPSRALITSNASGGSGGINTSALSRDTGGGGLAGRSTTVVEGVVGGDGGGGPGGGGTLRRGASGKASRSIEDIKLVFDRNKGSIYTLYNRALRQDPTLQGKVVVKLTIAPSGQVLDCQLVSSELRAPDLERKLVVRIKQFDFGAKAVDAMVVTYPIDFLPS
jgi:TonB family protein